MQKMSHKCDVMHLFYVMLMSWEDFFNSQGANTRVQIKIYSNDLISKIRKCYQIISKKCSTAKK